MAKYIPPKRSWLQKFGDSFRGMGMAIATQNSFWAHLAVGGLVIAVAAWVGVSAVEGMLLGLCITLVMTTELMNTAVELIAKKVTDEESELIRNALDIASAAVLMTVLGSITVGIWILLPKLWALFS